MLSSIHITGHAPENFEQALAELKNELGFTVSPKGTPVTAVKGDHLGVVCDGKTVTIKNGSKGSTGSAGKTPVRGTDYWTAADKSAMVSDVLAALPTWNGGSY